MPTLNMGQNQAPPSPRQMELRKYETGRTNLLIAIIITAINIISPILGLNFLVDLSIFTPSFLSYTGALICGMYPDEFYVEMGLDDTSFYEPTYYYIMLIVSVIITLVFLLTWVLSKNGKVAWLITATVLFLIDGLVMLFIVGISIDLLAGAIFHVWIIYSLIAAIIAHNKLKNMPIEEEEAIYSSVLDAFANPDPNNFE